MTQVVQRSLPTPEVRGSNPVIDKIYIEHWQLCCKGENKEKRGKELPFLTGF